MLVNTYPKPKIKKHRAKNNPKPIFENKCAVCGLPYACTHEVFGGTGKRQLSIKYKMQIHLCYRHHLDHKAGIHYNLIFRNKIQREYQKKFNKMYPDLDFEKIFGKNYL